MLVKDRVKESATGTSGNLSLQGADTGYVAFSTIGNNEHTYYCVISADRTQWEVGYGQLNSDSSELVRPATVISNSAGNTSRLTLGSGTHTVFCTSPASKSVYLDNSGAASVAISVFTNDSGYLTSYTETNDLSSAVTWANVPNANITQSSVTQHQAALSITESQISDFGTYLTSQTSHTDVVVDGDFVSEGLMKRGGSAGTYSIVTDNSSNWNTAFGWGNHASAGYLTSFTETNDLSSAVTWANIPNANITQGSVTQHQAALSITESQISDLGSYITASSTNTLTNKSGAISQWTNDSGYLTAVSGLAVSNFDAATVVLEAEGIGSNDNDTTIPTSAAVKDYVDTNAGGATTLNGLTDVEVDTTNKNIWFEVDGAAPTHGTISGAEHNIAIGNDALSSLTTADYNIAIGKQALEDTSWGWQNIAIGHESAMDVTSGYQNVFIGPAVGGQLTGSCRFNVIVGQSAANGIAAAVDGAAVVGQEAMYGYTGSYNTAIGRRALYAASGSGGSVTAIGAFAGQGAAASTGSCTYVGYNTGKDNTSEYMLYIGYDEPSLDGSIIKAEMAEKHIGFGMVDDHFSASTGSATIQVYPKDAADNAVEIKMTATPAVATRALEVKNSSGTSQYSVTADGAVKSKMLTETDGATVTFDLNESNFFTVTLGGSRTFALSNSTTGQRFVIRVVQDGTGSRGVTWWSGLKWANATAPTLTTAGNSIDTFGFICTDSSTPVYEGYIIGQNVATPS